MKQKKPQPKLQKIPLSSGGLLKLSSGAYFSVFVVIGLLVAGLLYGACFQVSSIKIVSPPTYNPHAHLENHVRSVVSGFPIEAMAPYIARQNKMTAAFLVAIGKKESNWGKRVPVDSNGEDCYNYWGYKGAGTRGVAMGHGCFGSLEEAVSVVGKRIETLTTKYDLNTPEELVVWKCGWSCSGHNAQGVKKWISDVKLYFDKVYN